MRRKKNNEFRSWYDGICTLEEALVSKQTAAYYLGVSKSMISKYIHKKWITTYNWNKTGYVSFKDVKKVMKYHNLREEMPRSAPTSKE